MLWLLGVLFIVFDESRNNLFNISGDNVVGYFVDRRVGVVIDGDDDRAFLHTGDMLYLSRYTACDV